MLKKILEFTKYYNICQNKSVNEPLKKSKT